MHLNILVLNKDLVDKYTTRSNHSDDSGVDLYFQNDITIPANAISFKIDLGVQCEPTDTKSGYDLVPRSSIVKTPLRQCNSIGIIDNNYRNNIMVFVDNVSNKEVVLKKHTSLFQLVAPDRLPITLTLVDKVSETARKGGFGSTNK